MKKIALLLALIFVISTDAFSQTQTAFCDIYARGSARKMRVTIMYKANHSITLATKTNIGDILNMLAKDGWILDKDIIIPRHWQWSMVTRHKLHLIMKKEYLVGENPFAVFENNEINNNSTNSITTYSNANSQFNTEKSLEGSIFPIAIVNISELKTSKKIHIGQVLSYKGKRISICDINDDKATITAINNFYGNWSNAKEFYQSLGEEWYIPSIGELEKIFSTDFRKYSYLYRNKLWSWSRNNSSTPKPVIYKVK